MDDIVITSTIKLNEIAVSMIHASNTQQDYRNNVQMICLLDELLNSQFRNSLEIALNTFVYMSLKNETNDFPKIDINKFLDKQNDFCAKKNFDSFRTFAFLIFEIIILINDSIDNQKITESFFSNFIDCFNKLNNFEKEHLRSNILIETLKNVLVNKEEKA